MKFPYSISKAISALLLIAAISSADARPQRPTAADFGITPEMLAEVEREQAKGNEAKIVHGKVVVTHTKERPFRKVVDMPERPEKARSMSDTLTKKIEGEHKEALKQWKQDTKAAKAKQKEYDALHEQGLKEWAEREGLDLEEVKKEGKKKSKKPEIIRY